VVRIHFIIEMIRWTGFAPWEFESLFPGSLTSTFPAQTLYPKSGESDRAGKPLKAAVVYLLYGSERYFDFLREAIRWLSFSFLEQFP